MPTLFTSQKNQLPKLPDVDVEVIKEYLSNEEQARLKWFSRKMRLAIENHADYTIYHRRISNLLYKALEEEEKHTFYTTT